jgi:hypothetical protein
MRRTRCRIMGPSLIPYLRVLGRLYQPFCPEGKRMSTTVTSVFPATGKERAAEAIAASSQCEYKTSNLAFSFSCGSCPNVCDSCATTCAWRRSSLISPLQLIAFRDNTPLSGTSFLRLEGPQPFSE